MNEWNPYLSSEIKIKIKQLKPYEKRIKSEQQKTNETFKQKQPR